MISRRRETPRLTGGSEAWSRGFSIQAVDVRSRQIDDVDLVAPASQPLHQQLVSVEIESAVEPRVARIEQVGVGVDRAEVAPPIQDVDLGAVSQTVGLADADAAAKRP